MALRAFFSLALVLVLLGMAISASRGLNSVSVEHCYDVVAHNQKVLGNLAPVYPAMMARCKVASDSERACQMAADSHLALTQCS
ncbi:hypothetical protein NFHSH190041_09810 [Shewanella sp. NFH-SH190041]|uniref:hypothetical protein n=1 Tax=Shewanella sp. NFH-SH190041 TaxID=2950245 RepID=UPI0021C3F0F0|nr:hypothetical protein [Shewanella sp. NFH-SH190041]BDM63529.1 hypothetical protein NFHSH190041_09810 [Shewanella sp. NFH-SH190041]